MTRRECITALAALGVAATSPVSLAEASAQPRLHIAFVMYDGMTALDMIGASEVLASPNFTVDYVAANMAPVMAETTADKRLGLLPTATFADVPTADILCVPGTSNPYAQMGRHDMLEWAAAVGQQARWVTSVCTGSFILGAAGLLKGYQATSHWALADQLACFGAKPVRQRVVHDRNRVTGAGVTSGVDFGLTLLALTCGQETAKARQLVLEYDPQPPFDCGSPATAPAFILKNSRDGYKAYLAQAAPNAREQLEAAATRLGVPVPNLDFTRF